MPSLIEENRRLHQYLTEGVLVEVRRPDGTIGGEQARLIDLDHPDANDWLAVNQFTVIQNKATRRADAGLVKRILRRYGYPPDLQDAAVQNVPQQAEALSAEWAEQVLQDPTQ